MSGESQNSMQSRMAKHLQNLQKTVRLQKGVRPVALSVSVVTAAVVLSFQNCSMPPTVEGPGQFALEAEKMPFAYDAHLDQIAYMSCATAGSSTLDPEVYFSFRAGAYRSGGVRLSQEFRNEMAPKPPERQAALLVSSPANTNTSVQMALRPRADLQNILIGGGSAPRREFDFVNLFEPLGTEDLADLLVQLPPQTRLRYLRNGFIRGSRFEGQLNFQSSPALAAQVRTQLQNTALMALTYTAAAETTAVSSLEYQARAPADFGGGANAKTSVFGKGYQLRFTQPTFASAPSHGSFPNVVLQDLTEVSLVNTADRTASSGTWVCPDAMKLQIVRPEDIAAGRVACTRAPDPAVLSPDLVILRRTLGHEHWYIDLVNRCVVPKRSPNACYGADVQLVSYDPRVECTEGTSQVGRPACVSYVSVCHLL